MKDIEAIEFFFLYPTWSKFGMYYSPSDLWRPLKWLFAIAVLIWSSLVTFMVLNEWEWEKNIVHFLGTEMLAAAVVTELFIFDRKKFVELSHSIKKYALPWKAAGDQTYEQIVYENKVFHVKLAVNSLLLFIIAILWEPFPDIFRPLYGMSQKYLSKWVSMNNTLVPMILICCMYGAVCLCWKLPHIFRHISIQLTLLIELSNKISSEIDENSGDDEYQRKIHKNLIRFVEAHTNSIKLSGILIKNFRWILLPLYMYATLIVVLQIYLSLIKENVSGRYFPLRGFISLIGIAFHIYVMLDSGQKIADKSETIFRLTYGWPWYNWNKKNRQIVLLLMGNTLKPLTVTCFDIVSVEYSLTCMMAKTCWAMIAVLKSMHDRNYQSKSN